MRDISEAEALFFAGAALAALDSVAKSEPPWAGAWRARLALKSAAAVAQNLLKRREDEAALRDAVALAKPGQDLGPAGRSTPPSGPSAGPGDPLPSEAARRRRRRSPGAARPRQGRGARRRAEGRRARPAGAARRGHAAEAVVELRADAEPLALFCADAALARALGWPVAAAAARRRAVLAQVARAKGGGRARAKPAGASSWRSLTPARRSPRSTSPTTCRAAPHKLAEAAPKLRAKGKTGALEALLGDDAVSAAAPLPGLSDRARRRLFERLVTLGAARELTGRPAFRLYGL